MALHSEVNQQAALRTLYDLARREIRDALQLIDDPNDAATIAEVIYQYVPNIADRYGLAAGTLAADWYEDMREAAEVAGHFTAVQAATPDMGRYESMALWVANKTDIEQLVSGGVQRIIVDSHRQTVMRSAFADPAASGWARFASGATTCQFCYMLVSRGAVYTSDTAKFGSHDNCDCGAGPVWKGRAGSQTVDDYKASARFVTQEMRDDYAVRVHDWIGRNL